MNCRGKRFSCDKSDQLVNRNILLQNHILTNKEELLGNLKPGVGSLFCSDHEIEKLQGFNKAKSRIITLRLREQALGILVDLLGITPWNIALDRRGPGDLADFPNSPLAVLARNLCG